MSKNENEMSKEEIAEAIKNHGGDPSMTLGSSLDALISQGKVKVSKENGSKNKGGNNVAPVAPAPKFSFQKPLPKVARFLSPEEEQEVIEKERQYRADKAEALKAFATQIKHLVPDLVTSLRAFATKPEEVQKLPGNREKDEVNRNGLADILNQEDLEAKALAVKAVSASFVLTCPKEFQQVKELLERLVNYDLLLKMDRDQLKKGEEGIYNAFGSSYKLTPTFANDSDAREILRNMRDLVRVVKEDSRARYQTLEEAFEAKNTDPISLENLLDMAEGHAEKKSGTIVLENPAHEERRDGEVRTYRGGKILYGVRDNTMFCIDGLGGTQKVARNLADMGTFLFLNQLREERVRFTDNNNMSEGTQKSVVLLHKLARIGIRTMREKIEKATAEKAAAEVKAKAEAEFAKERETVLAMAGEVPVISNEDFLLNGKRGAMPLDNLPNPWIRRDMKSGKVVSETAYEHPENALAIRGEDDKIRVVCPSRLATLYQGAQQEAFPGDKFTGLVYPLGGMLRTMLGITKQTKDEADRKAKKVQENQLTVADKTESDGDKVIKAMVSEIETGVGAQ